MTFYALTLSPKCSRLLCLVFLKCFPSLLAPLFFSASSFFQFCSLLYVELCPTGVNNSLLCLLLTLQRPFGPTFSLGPSSLLQTLILWARKVTVVMQEDPVTEPLSYFFFSACDFTANAHILTLISYFNLYRSYLLLSVFSVTTAGFRLNSLAHNGDFFF